MIDWQKTGFYECFLRGSDKAKKEKNPVGKYSTKEERDATMIHWKDHQKYSNVLGYLTEQAVLMDADTQEDSELFKKIIEGEGLQCLLTKRNDEASRGLHGLFINPAVNGIQKCGTHIQLACGVTVDIKIGGSGKHCCELLQFHGVVREAVFEKEPYQTVPRYMYPVRNLKINFQTMSDGDGRNDTLFRYILTLQQEGFTKDEIKETFRIINKYVLKDPLSDDELETIMRDDAFRKEAFFKSGKFLHDKFADYMRREQFVKKINGQLHIYNGRVYISDPLMIERGMLQVIPSLTDSRRREVMKYLNIQCDNEGKQNPDLIAFRNGVLNVKTEELLPFSPDLIVTNSIPWDFNKNAECPDVDKALDTLSDGDETIRLMLEEMAGACLYRDNTLGGGKCMILKGEKNNGKTTVIGMIRSMLGKDNCSALDFKELDEKFKTAELSGKLANIGDDISDTFKEDVSIFKKIVTGNSEINGERKGQDPFKFIPYCDLIFSANDIPRMKDPTGAALRRLLIIPLNHKFSETDPSFDPFISRRLEQQDAMEYFIQLALKGLNRVLDARHFTEASSAKEEKDEFELENDSVLSYLNETEKAEILNEATADVYRDYTRYCSEYHLLPVSNITFSKKVTRKLNCITKASRITAFGGKTRIAKIFIEA
jgi:putative DNA primase/helicase